MRKAATVLILLITLGLLSCDRPQSVSTPAPTVVLIVRHGEKEAQGGNDPNLSDAGARRAQALIDVAGDAGVNAIYSTQYKRGYQTAQPLSERFHIPVTEVPVTLDNPGDYGAALAKEILTRHTGQTVLVVSHTNIIPSLIKALSQKQIPEIPDPEYDHLYIVIVPKEGPARLVKARYGAASGE